VPWNAEQLDARAQVLAAALLGLLENERLVARFVDSYAEEGKRSGLKAHAERYRELLATIGRESLLALAAESARLLRRALARPRAGRAAAPALADSFARALVASLAERLSWAPEERDEFRRDLELYLRLDEPGVPEKPGRPESPHSAFVDRCALLLDPPMLSQARHAAAAYRAELGRQAERIFRGIFRGREAKRTRPRTSR